MQNHHAVFAPSSASDSTQFAVTATNDDSTVDSSRCLVNTDIKRDKRVKVDNDKGKQVATFSTKSRSVDYFNDPLYIRFEEYTLLKKRTIRQMEMQKF